MELASTSTRYSGSSTCALRSCAVAMPTSRSLRSRCSPGHATLPSGLAAVSLRWCFGSTPGRSEHGIGIGGVAVVPADADLEVEVRRRGVARHAGEPDHLALGDGAARPDELREVGVEV